jgi:ribosomal protein S18 acetylase RimI-like enzyme
VYSSRNLTAPDIPSMLTVLTACQSQDSYARPPQAEQLQRQLGSAQSQGWFDHTGQLIAFALLWAQFDAPEPDCYTQLNLLPKIDPETIGPQFLEWAYRCHAQLQQQKPLRLRIGFSSSSPAWPSFAHHAFVIDRIFERMARQIDPYEQFAQPNSAFQFRGGPHKLDAWLELFNAAFADHWNQEPIDMAEAQALRHNPSSIPLLDRVAYHDQQLVGFCLAEQQSPQQAFINYLGVHPHSRRQGLARALLTDICMQAQQLGINTILLSVDRDSTNKASQLYYKAGFRSYETHTIYGYIG